MKKREAKQVPYRIIIAPKKKNEIKKSIGPPLASSQPDSLPHFLRSTFRCLARFPGCSAEYFAAQVTRIVGSAGAESALSNFRMIYGRIVWRGEGAGAGGGGWHSYLCISCCAGWMLNHAPGYNAR